MKILKRIFTDGLSGMTTGWFCTFVIGTILQQIGSWIGGSAGGLLQTSGLVLKVFAGAAIGAGVSYKLGESAVITSAGGSSCRYDRSIQYTDYRWICHNRWDGLSEWTGTAADGICCCICRN